MLEPEANYFPEEEYRPKINIEIKKHQKQKAVFIAQVSTLIILLLIVSFYFYYYFSNLNSASSPPIAKITPPKISPQPTIFISKWATDSAVINENANLKNQSDALNLIDLVESDLSFPALDFQVNFQQK